MSIHPGTIQTLRAELEGRIENLIALLDLIDGDENLEPYLAGTYPTDEDREDDDEREREDVEPNGDEQDYSGEESDQSAGKLQGGSGI
jgi:hypothetical protein